MKDPAIVNTWFPKLLENYEAYRRQGRRDSRETTLAKKQHASHPIAFH